MVFTLRLARQLSARERGVSLCSRHTASSQGFLSAELTCAGETPSSHQPSASVKNECNWGLLTEGLLPPWPPPRYVCAAQEGGEEGAWGSCFFSKPVSEKETLPWYFFFKKQILRQICNQIQIGTNSRSKGSQRELFILKATFPPGQEVPACAWHDGSALPESPVRACRVLKCWLSTPLSPGCCCLTLTFPKCFRWEGRKGMYLLSWGFTCQVCLEWSL